jgi:hypothetical protein
MKFKCSKESKTTYQVMKDFRIVPYSEISKRLDEATEKTIELFEKKVHSTKKTIKPAKKIQKN